MGLSQTIKKQWLVAVYSSPAISALSVTPVFILMKASFSLYPWVFVFGVLLTLVVWAINIGVYTYVKPVLQRYLISCICCLLLTFGFLHAYFFRMKGWHFGSGGGVHFHLIIFLAVNMVVLILQDLVVSREKNAAMERENSQLRLHQVEAMNLQLMQQVQPHFLFNSLSTLKSLIGISPEQASEYLVRLSGFLRASISSHRWTTVKVGHELDLSIDYLEMQRIRFGEALQFVVEVPEGVREEFYLPVFSIQLLVENAIKHNILTKERPLWIRVHYEDRVIIVTNNLQKKGGAGEGGMKGLPETSVGTGLINLRERYKALTGDPVVVRETAHEYSVSITVFTHENSDH